MTLLLIGANFRNVSLENLETLEKKSNEISVNIFNADSQQSGIEGGVVLSTCNRFEIYVDTDAVDESRDFIEKELASTSNLPSDNFFIKTADEAIEHLFNVTSGLDSMIVGESEISGQVRRAFSEAQIQGHTSRIVEFLFQKTLEVSKKIATETGVGAAGRSLITSSLEMIKENGFELSNKSALVIGTGAYARVVTAALERELVSTIYVYSSSNRAESFSEERNTVPVIQEDLSKVLESIDLIVACSGTHGTVVSSNQIEKLNKEFLPIIDLSLSRDIEKTVQDLPNVFLIDLERIYRESPPVHLETVTKANAIAKDMATAASTELRLRRNDPYVRLLREHVDKIVNSEVSRVEQKHGLDSAELVAQSLHKVTKSIFHKPTIAARESNALDSEFEYQNAIRILFGLDAINDKNE